MNDAAQLIERRWQLDCSEYDSVTIAIIYNRLSNH